MGHEEYHVIERAFITGFRSAPDKRAFLQLARIPFELDDGGEPFKLIEVKFEDAFSVGAASPGFGSRELVYHPLPGEMVTQKEQLFLVYVSATGRREFSLDEVYAFAGNGTASSPHLHNHDHGHGHSHEHHHDHGHQIR